MFKKFISKIKVTNGMDEWPDRLKLYAILDKTPHKRL